MHPHTDPANQEIARRYYRWVREVQAQLASGANDAESYAAILAAFPEAESGQRSDGEIEVYY